MKSNSFSVSHVKYQPLNTYHVLVGSAGLTHVVPDFTVCVGTCVHHILSNINLTQSSHDVPFHTYHDSLHVNLAYKLLHANTMSHVDNGFQEKSDVVYHPSNVAFVCVRFEICWICSLVRVHPFSTSNPVTVAPLLNVTIGLGIGSDQCA